MTKRYRVRRTPGHYVQRNRKGRFVDWTSIPRGIRVDTPRRAKTTKPRSEFGYGHQADYPLRHRERRA